MWADTILILVISVCTALLGEVRETERDIFSSVKQNLKKEYLWVLLQKYL